MFMTWFRENKISSVLWLVFRLYLGWSWLTAGIEKLSGDKPFDAQGFLAGAVKKAVGDHPVVQPWWAAFLNKVALPHVELFNFLVMWGEILVGIALLLGLFTTFAALMGAVMNFAFLFSGSTSTNVQMVLLTVFVLAAGANAGRYGLDRYVLPYLLRKMHHDGHKPTATGTGPMKPHHV
ncbi:TQO small subunit DoxD [Paenibacillus sp. UNC451MF]|uniref:TQO small subunit DoxD n=1 Tax=Paenibacillus sp. UNC451MF TaxID=1449063 RepID=UPI00048B4FD4|nr:DoxX family protein [Paenibacillus sp. UNC451MF]